MTDPLYRFDQLELRHCKVRRCSPRDRVRSCVGPEKASTYFGDSAGDKNLTIMADLSNSSDMMALEGLPEDLRKDIDVNMHTHCYRVTEQGVIVMKIFVIDELRMYDLPKHCKSTSSFIIVLLNFVDDPIKK